MDQRIKFIVRADAGLESFSKLCREFGISRPTGYRWLQRYREVGCLSELTEKSRQPLFSPTRTSAEQETRVVELRQEYGWGAKKLHVLLEKEGAAPSVRTINRILAREGLLDPADSHPHATQRFERPAPNDLWQMDFKGQFKLSQGYCYPLSILDDHSRFLLGLFALPNPRAEAVHQGLVSCFQTYGLPKAMLMDHGTPWWSTTNGWGLTWLSVALIQQGIQLINGRIAHPQTQGKVERFHRTLEHEVRHSAPESTLSGHAETYAKIRQRYNHVRPHEALEMAVPADRYQPSQRPYEPSPLEWVYPPHVDVIRLNSQGMLRHGSQRHFVCEALAGQLVGVQEGADRLLVTFRHMYIREIILATGVSRPLLHLTLEGV